MDNLTFYKFVELKNLPKLKKTILDFCNENNIKGKILLAPEGINGYLSGEKNDTKAFEEFIHSLPQFKDLWIKHNPTNRYNSKRMLVKLRKQVIAFHHKYDIKNTANYITATELDELYESGEEFVIIDTRNNYEYEEGHFKNAVKMDTDNFSEFAEEVEKIRENAKGKKIVTYCTGGVRCETATAYMNGKNFENVFQLKGGIINYGIEKGQGNWKGRCFVFDDRGSIKIDPKEQEKDDYPQCNVCFVPCEKTHICNACHKEFLMCDNCDPLLEGCCSKFCRNKIRFEKEEEIKT